VVEICVLADRRVDLEALRCSEAELVGPLPEAPGVALTMTWRLAGTEGLRAPLHAGPGEGVPTAGAAAADGPCTTTRPHLDRRLQTFGRDLMKPRALRLIDLTAMDFVQISYNRRGKAGRLGDFRGQTSLPRSG
jgi:hypothetical protein